MSITMASVVIATSEPSASTPDSLHLSPRLTMLTNIYNLHLSLELPANLTLELDLTSCFGSWICSTLCT